MSGNLDSGIGRMQIEATAVQGPEGFDNAGALVQLRDRRESAMRGLGYGPRIERRVVSSRLA